MIHKLRLTKVFLKRIHKMRLTKIFHKNDSQNETHKNVSNRLKKNKSKKETHKNISQDSYKCFRKMIHKIRERERNCFINNNIKSAQLLNILTDDILSQLIKTH